jgi:hypothetical protein
MKVIKVLQGPTARYLPATGVLLVSRAAEVIYNMLSNNKIDPDEQDEVTTFVHECVHHLQVLSSPYLWLDAVARIDASVNVVLPQASTDRKAAAEEIVRRDYAFRYRAFGISCAELCEASAVLESYKARAANPLVDEFLRWRDVMFPGKGNSVYRRTFDVMAERCGKESAFDLLSVVTYLALQGDIPGQSFELLMRDRRLKDKKLIGASAHNILEALDFRIPDMANAQNVAKLHTRLQHPTLYPVLLETMQGLADEALETLARPHRALRPILDCALPPILVGPHQQGVPRQVAFGAAYKSKELRRNLHVYTALVATAERLVTVRESFVPCPLGECPNHSTGLCAGWYVPPLEPDLCGYRAEIRSAGGKELYQIAEDCVHVAKTRAIEDLRSTSDLGVIFPHAEVMISRTGANDLSYAEAFDERHDLDPEDNDGLNVLVCKKCQRMWQEWASQRKMKRGYIAVCPSCGAEQEMGSDRAFIIHM